VIAGFCERDEEPSVFWKRGLVSIPGKLVSAYQERNRAAEQNA
jgi:hypothetical protein